jgi:hypothetical protein
MPVLGPGLVEFDAVNTHPVHTCLVVVTHATGSLDIPCLRENTHVSTAFLYAPKGFCLDAPKGFAANAAPGGMPGIK